MNYWINILQHSKESWKGSKEPETPEEQKLVLIIISEELQLTDKSENIAKWWIKMATKNKTRKKLESIFEDYRRTYSSPTIEITSYYRYLDQIKENLRRFSKKKIRLQQKHELQKIKKAIKRRKEKELEDYLFRSRYHNY